MVCFFQATLTVTAASPQQKCDRPSDEGITGRVSSFWIFRFNGPQHFHLVLMIMILHPPPANLWPLPL